MTSPAEHAARWSAALTSNTDATVDLFADNLVYDDHTDRDHVIDTAITKSELAPKIAAYANSDAANGVGIHEFSVTDTFAVAGVNGFPSVAILWDWTGTSLASYRGVPTGGKTLSTRGITWHQFDANGKITREVTYWNDTPILQELGIPISTPEYWVEGFDPSSLVSS